MLRQIRFNRHEFKRASDFSIHLLCQGTTEIGIIKMKKLVSVSAFCLLSITNTAKADDKPVYYGLGLCASPQYECVKVTSGESWDKLFPDEQQRDLVQRVNRSYNSLWPGKEIVVPRDLAHVTLLDLSPFPLKIEAENEKQIVVDQDKLAWGAYDEQGQLVKWGPVASGADRCSDNSSPTCRTMTGIFRIFSKEGDRCKSNIFPVGKGGAKMPYCMYFHKGLALHGSTDIPGYRASHGCVRMFTRDAKWLNEEWVEAGNDKNLLIGTKVVIRPVTLAGKPTSPFKNGSTGAKRQAANAGTNLWKDPDSLPSKL